MSYSIDRTRAVALEQKDGVWSLELEQLVRINRNTFRPRRQRVRGAQAIMQHLLMNQGALVNSTRQVLETEVDDERIRFELQGNGWVMAPPLEEIKPKVEPPTHDIAASAAVVKEVASLRARVEQLEALVSALQDRLEAGAAPMTYAQQPTGASPDDDADGGGIGAAPDDAAPEPEPELTFEPLKMPTLEAVVDLVKGLVGDEVAMSRVDSNWTLAEPQKSYLAPLKGDDGEVIGALVMDLEATIRLAGGMLMEPQEELDAQVEDEAPSDDILDAAGEVLNTLTSAVNKVSGNAHVRAGPLEMLDVESHDWLAKARVRQDFKSSIGGLIAVLGR